MVEFLLALAVGHLLAFGITFLLFYKDLRK